MGLPIEKSNGFGYLELCIQKAADNYSIMPKQIACLEQIHSNRIVQVEKRGIYKQADGLITAKKGLYLLIQTADCAPIFLYAPNNEIIAALHGGWRGIVNDIIANAVHIMQADYDVDPRNLRCAVGPSLKACCFEIGEDILHIFDNRFILNRAGKYYLQFSQLILAKLQQAGIIQQNIDILEHCTKCNNDIFYSYRGDNQETGRMLNVIGMALSTS